MPRIYFEVFCTEIPVKHVLDRLGFHTTSIHRNQLPGPCPVRSWISSHSRSF
jgi:hypothetical protein